MTDLERLRITVEAGEAQAGIGSADRARLWASLNRFLPGRTAGGSELVGASVGAAACPPPDVRVG